MSGFPVVWLTPAEVRGPQRSYQRVSDALGDAADVVLKDLEVWHLRDDEPYDMDVETAAVAHLARSRGWPRFHLFGFSAGATVALGAALRLGDAVRSLALFEPATIGDDDWSPVETVWRADVQAICDLARAEDRNAAFAALVLRPGDEPPGPRGAVASWDSRRERLEDLLAHVGFDSDDLASVRTPGLVVTGRRSHPRFALLAERLVAVMPAAEQVTFDSCSHLDPPMRAAPAAFAALLLDLWARSGGA